MPSETKSNKHNNNMPPIEIKVANDYPSFIDYLEDNGMDSKLFEEDITEGKYQIWLEEYPEHVKGIFCDLVNLCYDEFFTDEVIGQFQLHGVDINEHGNFRSDAGSTTPLGHACEFRRRKLMESLLGRGANVNKKDNFGVSPLDSYINGHNIDYLPKVNNQDQMQSDIELLQRYGVILEAQAWIVEENFENNREFQPNVRNDFFKQFCRMIVKTENAN